MIRFRVQGAGSPTLVIAYLVELLVHGVMLARLVLELLLLHLDDVLALVHRVLEVPVGVLVELSWFRSG